MPKLKILILPALLILILTACNLKLNINSNLNQSELKVEDNQNLNVPAEGEGNEPANINDSGENEITSYEVSADEENKVEKIKVEDVTYEDFKSLCGLEVMVYAQPEDSYLVIFQPFNPGSDKPVSQLYAFNLQNGSCAVMEVSRELSDFGARILSPDQIKMALALETDEAKTLKILDLVNDKAMTLVTLPDDETLNAGYGALSNHFDIKWLDNKMLQYTVFEDTVKNYPKNAPDHIEKVLQVRVVNIE